MFLIVLLVTWTAMVACAGPVGQTRRVTIPLTYFSTSTNISNIALRGQQRIAMMNRKQRAGIFSRQLHNGPATNDDVYYAAPVTIGGTVFQLVVDTSSPTISCTSQSKCEPSKTGRSLGDTVSCPSSYADIVSYAGLTVQGQTVTVDSNSIGADGTFGFGPADLGGQCSVSSQPTPTFLDNLYRQRSIGTEVLGIYFKPESGSDTNDNNGELTLGATDPSKYFAPLKYFSKLQSGSASPYWGISVSGIYYGSTSIGSASSAIVDTATTLIYIPTAAYNAFLRATGGTTDSSSGLVSFSTAPVGNFTIAFDNVQYPLTPKQYLIPQAQYANFGLSSNKYYGWINNGGSGGINFIIGQKFLEQYYSVYDTTNSKIGFATRT